MMNAAVMDKPRIETPPCATILPFVKPVLIREGRERFNPRPCACGCQPTDGTTTVEDVLRNFHVVVVKKAKR